MNQLDQLKSVLCNPEGKCCIAGSDEDRAIVDRALEALAQPEQEPVAYVTGVYGGRFTYAPLNPAMVLPIGMALYSSPQEKT